MSISTHCSWKRIFLIFPMCLLFAQRLSKQIPISRIVRLCTFLLFLPIFMHRYTALSQKSEVPIWVFRFFHCYNGTWNELQICRAMPCWANLGEQSSGLFDSWEESPVSRTKKAKYPFGYFAFFFVFSSIFLWKRIDCYNFLELLLKTCLYDWTNTFLKELTHKRKLALRMGELLESSAGYELKPEALKNFAENKLQWII